VPTKAPSTTIEARAELMADLDGEVVEDEA
jgi:hypothetical protein